MKLLIQIMDDNGEILIEHRADPTQPSQWRAQPGQRFTSGMPQQSDQNATGVYELCGFSYQPHVRVGRANGLLDGPGILPTITRPIPHPQPTSMWGTPSPTQAPQSNPLQGYAPTKR